MLPKGLKIGTKIKCNGNWCSDSCPPYITKNKIYEIQEIRGEKYRVENDRYIDWWINNITFDLLRKEIKNEVDWLNAVQENFKE